jgi:hypothetical protein
LTSAGGGARGADADVVEMVQQVERILVDPVRAGPLDRLRGDGRES